MNQSTQNLKNIPLGQYTDKLLQYANQTFATIHHKFLKEIWGDNKTTNKLHSNQTYTDWQNGRYEVYIPTRDSLEYNLKYYRIAIQIQELNSNDTKHADAYKLMEPIKQPLGEIESELLILIAPHQDRWGLVRGFKHRNKPGYFTAVFTNKSPEIVWKRILDHIGNFIQKRIDGFFACLGFETWLWKWAQTKEDNMLYYSTILGRFSYVIRQSVFTLVKLYQHVRDFMRGVLKEIGIQNVVKQAIEPLKRLSLPELQRVFSGIREQLQITVTQNDKGLLMLEAIRRR